MIFNQIKYKWQNNDIEITVNIFSSIARVNVPFGFQYVWEGKYATII